MEAEQHILLCRKNRLLKECSAEGFDIQRDNDGQIVIYTGMRFSEDTKTEYAAVEIED